MAITPHVPKASLEMGITVLDPKVARAHMDRISAEPKGRIVKARHPEINGSFDAPVRKGRKPEVNKNHDAVLSCREFFQKGVPLHRVAILAGVDYSMLARWYDKGWMAIPKSKRKVVEPPKE
jgi:hypothetical protein